MIGIHTASSYQQNLCLIIFERKDLRQNEAIVVTSHEKREI